MNSPVSFGNQDGIGLLLIDNPPVNALAAEVIAGIADAVARFVSKPRHHRNPMCSRMQRIRRIQLLLQKSRMPRRRSKVTSNRHSRMKTRALLPIILAKKNGRLVSQKSSPQRWLTGLPQAEMRRTRWRKYSPGWQGARFTLLPALLSHFI